jgi:hypothetical protein
VSWTYAPAFDAAHRAALGNRKNLVYIAPPAGWAVLPLLGQLPAAEGVGVDLLVLVPEAAEAAELASLADTVEPLRPVHCVSGLARAGRLIKAGAIRTLVATPPDALQLVGRSTLKLASLPRVAILWPELHAELGAAGSLDTILSECFSAQRLIATADDRPVGEFLERHARRAPTLAAARPPEAPVGRARYALVDRQRLTWAVACALDSLNPAQALLWDPTPLAGLRWAAFRDDPTVRVGADPDGEPVEVALAIELPSADALVALRAVAPDVVVLPRATQLGYLRRIAEPLAPLRLPSEADRARDRQARVRGMVRGRLESADVAGDLATLTPLFDEYDPALVAAAALSLTETEGGRSTADELPTWVHIHLNAGRRDRLRTGDVVGALLNAVGLPKDHIGRVDIRESFTVVEVRAAMAERTLKGLEGVTLRGRAIAARVDRR